VPHLFSYSFAEAEYINPKKIHKQILSEADENRIQYGHEGESECLSEPRDHLNHEGKSQTTQESTSLVPKSSATYQCIRVERSKSFFKLMKGLIDCLFSDGSL
jgi:hypothetical protein